MFISNVGSLFFGERQHIVSMAQLTTLSNTGREEERGKVGEVRLGFVYNPMDEIVLHESQTLESGEAKSTRRWMVNPEVIRLEYKGL